MDKALKPKLYKVNYSLLSNAATIDWDDVIIKWYRVTPNWLSYIVSSRERWDRVLDSYELTNKKEVNKIWFKLT